MLHQLQNWIDNYIHGSIFKLIITIKILINVNKLCRINKYIKHGQILHNSIKTCIKYSLFIYIHNKHKHNKYNNEYNKESFMNITFIIENERFTIMNHSLTPINELHYICKDYNQINLNLIIHC